MDEQKEHSTNEAKEGYSTPNRQGQYAKLATLLPKALEQLETLLDSKNENIRMGAINSILDRTIPKIKALELNNGTDANGNSQPFQLFIDAGAGFIPATVKFNATSIGSTSTEQQTVQDANLAPESPKDNDSNLRNSQAGTS